MPWIKFDRDKIVNSEKFIQLKKAMRWSNDQCLAKVLIFLSRTLENSETGDTSKWTPEYFANIMDNSHKYSEKFLNKLRETNWINTNGLIEDWLEYSSEYLHDKYSSGNRQKLIDICNIHGKSYGNRLIKDINFNAKQNPPSKCGESVGNPPSKCGESVGNPLSLSLSPLPLSPHTPLSSSSHSLLLTPGPPRKEIRKDYPPTGGNGVFKKAQAQLKEQQILWFQFLVDEYPSDKDGLKKGKKYAFKHFCATVKTEADFKRICSAVKNYKNSSTVKKLIVQNLSTWFNNWQDYENAEQKKEALKEALSDLFNLKSIPPPEDLQTNKNRELKKLEAVT